MTMQSLEMSEERYPNYHIAYAETARRYPNSKYHIDYAGNAKRDLATGRKVNECRVPVCSEEE